MKLYVIPQFLVLASLALTADAGKVRRLAMGGNGNGNAPAPVPAPEPAPAPAPAPGNGNGGGGSVGIAENTCENPDINLFGPGNGGEFRCCGSFFRDGDYVAACDTSSCVENFDAKNLNCHNYGSPQNPVGGNPDAHGGSALCPYKAGDQAICDVSAFVAQNGGVNCRDDNNQGAKTHCLGYVKCGTGGIVKNSAGYGNHSDGKPKDNASAACTSTDFPAGTICFYNGASENFKVCGGAGLTDEEELAAPPVPEVIVTAPPTKAPVTDSPTKAPVAAPEPEPEIEVRLASDPTPAAVTGAFGDPHVRTWGGEHFEYHGACDLVLVHNPDFANGLGLDVHIRNKRVKRWSYIDTAVLNIGGETLEVRGGENTNEFWVNGVQGNAGLENGMLPETIAGFPISFDWLKGDRRRFIVDLGNGEQVSFKTFKYFVRVNVLAKSEENFKSSVGLMGTYPEGKKVGRDLVSEVKDYDEFGQEWQVLPGEPMLFHNVEGAQAPMKCEMPIMSTQRRLAESTISLEEAEIACSRVNEDDRDACIFDVLATEDKDMAGAY